MYIHVKITPSAKEEGIREEKKGYLIVSVKEKAERNMANNRMLEILAQYLNISKGKIRIINGHHSPTKLISVIE